MENISNQNSMEIMEKIGKMFEIAYKKKPHISRRINFNEIHITTPSQRVRKINIKYLKNISKLLSYLFANIDKKPFTDKKANPYAFEVLWIILSILEENNLKRNAMKKKGLFTDVTLIENVGNSIEFGRYVITIPKYKQYIFNVKGYNLATLTIV